MQGNKPTNSGLASDNLSVRSEPLSLEEAQQRVKELQEWAIQRWGVDTEVQYRCPNYATDYSHSDYEGYCPSCGRRLKREIVPTDSQTWERNLDSFMSLPEYPEEPKGEL